ncbi:tRNA CCA-pyrophosphorylase [Weissella viridescens]|uniref:tRNA CCA-pyrophosphorylase n=1 Tax=Weissella viridescens TaxID=1629 RepID=A0A380P378_WEIVI|nr:tRNA CCA-pyrophosphorylase [Weissella viridescens]
MKLATLPKEFQDALPILETIEAAGYEAYFVGVLSGTPSWVSQFMMWTSPRRLFLLKLKVCLTRQLIPALSMEQS